jgi:hypothetical protein
MRDKGYLRWLRKQRDIVTGYGPTWFPEDPIEAAHGPVNGMSQKGPDNEAVPLSRSLHREQHRIGWPAFEAKYGFSRAEEAKRLYAEYLATKPTADGASPRRPSAR